MKEIRAVIRFYLDEDCQSRALADSLRQHGLDVVTTNEAGTTGLDDVQQLEKAFRDERVLVSNNIGDFAKLHSQWIAESRHHAGIVLVGQQTLSLGEVVRRLARLSRSVSAEEMRDRLEWLSSWGVR